MTTIALLNILLILLALGLLSIGASLFTLYLVTRRGPPEA